MMAKNRSLDEIKASAQSKLKKIAKKESQRAAIHAEIAALFNAAQLDGREALTAKEQSKLNTLVRQERESQLTDDELAYQIDQLGVLADVNLKLTTVNDALHWLNEFTAEHSDMQAVRWAERMVGHIEVHQKSRRGPPPSKAIQDVAENYLAMIRLACRREGIASASPKKEEIDRLVKWVNSNCDSQFVPRIERRQITQALKQIFDKKGR